MNVAKLFLSGALLILGILLQGHGGITIVLFGISGWFCAEGLMDV